MSRLLKGYEVQITQPYSENHKGVDMVGYKSKTCYILAHSDGEVVGIRTNCDKNYKTGGSYGNYVKLRHKDHYYTMYAHLKYKSIRVQLGDKVEKGEILGYMGNTGHSFGAHLHWEVRNIEDERIDPTEYIERDLPTEWDIGRYKLIVSKAIREEHHLGDNIVLVKNCFKNIQPLLTSQNPNDKAFFKVGTIRDITEIYVDKENRVWGKLTNTWIVLCNKDGTPQAIKV